jgi:hypothetical protein
LANGTHQVIVASYDVPPEQPEIRLNVDENGAVRRCSVRRWNSGAHAWHGCIPCGAEVHPERRFGDLLIARRLTVAWWFVTVAWAFATPRWAPSFKAEILNAEPID